MLARWEPFRELMELQNEMNRLLDSFARRSQPTTPGTRWVPAVDVYEDEGHFVLHVELPGLTRDEVELHLENRTLTIRGERPRPKGMEEERYHQVERFFGKFSRSFTLPATVEQDKIAANFKNGVLEVILPKTEAVKPKQIPVQAS